LASVIKVVLQTTENDSIEVSDISKIMISNSFAGLSDENSNIHIDSSRTLKEDLAEVDKKKIESTLEKCDGNVSKSAALLGISRETLHNKVRRYGINTQLFRGRKELK
jgi:transcriptional regulator of acetoin/glycerol metabolism